MNPQKQRPRLLSFEFFPPSTEEETAELRRTIDQLAKLKPRFCSVVPGILHIINYKRLARFSDNRGVRIPHRIRTRLESFGDGLASSRAFRIDIVTELCQQLLDGGAPGLHFYTLNHVDPTGTIWECLAFSGGQQVEMSGRRV